MNSDFLTPVKDSLIDLIELLPLNSMASKMQIHTHSDGFPDLTGVDMAILGVQEDRTTEENQGSGNDLHHIRSFLYQLFPGDWNCSMVDLGNIEKGELISDTHYAVSHTISSLLKKDILPIIIGGGHDITFSNYKAYDQMEQTVNLAVIDSKFDLGTLQDELSSRSYLSKIIMEKPNNLFNFSNIGYQTYFNSQEEIELLEKLNFDAYRLGKAKNLEIVEPVLRDADIVSIDIGVVRQSEAPGNKNVSPNGFNGEEICAIARYAGISDKVSSFGIYEFNSTFDSNHQTAHLIAQMIWYFIEGYNFRSKDYPFTTKEHYEKYTVLMENDDPINFYKSHKTGRWWMEINLLKDNKYKRHSLIPCTYQDYQDATKQYIPERWYKAQKKMI